MKNHFGRLASIGFVMRPHAFIAQGVQAAHKAGASHFTFMLGGRRVHVVDDPALGREVLALDAALAGFFYPEVLVPWLGSHSPLFLAEPSASALDVMLSIGSRLSYESAVRCASAALLVQSSRGFDAGDWVQRAAFVWALAAAMPDTCTLHARAALRAWLAAADTPALLVPRLRGVSRVWHGMPAAREQLVNVIAARGRPVDERHGYSPDVVDATIAMLLGAIDCPSIVALEALIVTPRSTSDNLDELLGEVLNRRPPVPLLLREAKQDIDLASDLHVRAGEGIAVSTVHTRLPFGAGPKACVGGRQARAFARAVLDVARAEGVALTGAAHRRRLRLSYGATSVQAVRRGGR